MSSFERVHESQSPAASQIEQRESVQTDSQAERVGLNIDVTQQWPDLPKTAVEYLTVNCRQPEHLPMALNFLREALKDDPSLLEDELGAESELDDFLQEAEKAASEREEQVLDSEITALDQGLAEDAAEKTVRDERVGGKKAEITRLDRLENNVDSDNVELDKKIEEGNTRNDVLTTLESNHGDKTGWAYLEAVRADVVKNNVSVPSDPDAPEGSVRMARLSETQQTEILAKLDAIAATLKQMTSLIDDPVEAQAFEALIANSSFKVGAENNYEVFSSLISNIDDSDLFSEATKTKLRVEGLGIPPFRGAKQMFNTLDQVAANGGRFRNADGQLVEFNEKNGVPMGRYSIHPDKMSQDRFVVKTEVGGRTLKMSFGRDTAPSVVDEMVSSAMIAQVFANRDLQAANRYILGGDGLAAQGVTEIKIDAFQARRAKHLYSAFMGVGADLRTGFPEQSDLREFERRLQVTHIDGDAKTGDNTGRGDLGWKEIGMLEANGEINIAKVKAVGAYINQDGVSLPEYSTLVEKFGSDSDQF